MIAMFKSCKKTLSSRITVAICVSMAGVGGNRRLLSEGTGFLAISDILFSPSFHLGGATIVIFPIDWYNGVRLVPGLYIGGTVVSLGVRQAFGDVVGGGVTVCAALVSKATHVVCTLGMGFPILKKNGPGFRPSVWLA